MEDSNLKNQMREKLNILLTGATGYVGGRLLTALQQDRFKIRCLTRRPEALTSRVAETTQAIYGDLLNRQSLDGVFTDIDVAFYMVHSMGSEKDFVEQDRLAAKNFSDAAAVAGIDRIIYLGGLGDSQAALSPHLQSRQEVGAILRASGVQVIEFRASVIIGSGSLSYELVRALVERLPVMITPKWVSIPTQPIAVSDVLEYLLAGIDLDCDQSEIFEIGGQDIVSYEGIMREYARQRGLTRVMIRVPVLTPYLSSLWLGLVTPIFARIGRKLVESIRHSTIVNDKKVLTSFTIRPRGLQTALAEAMQNEDREFAATRWSDALASSGGIRDYAGVRFGNRLIDSRVVKVDVTPKEAFTPIRRIGGDSGWYYANWLWCARGFIDLMIGGVGMRRGRGNPESLCVGDALDFWRVEAYEPCKKLTLFAEMKIPGRAWLEFEVSENSDGTTIRQTAIFDPIGLSGILYWWGVYPLHALIFSGMLKNIAIQSRISD